MTDTESIDAQVAAFAADLDDAALFDIAQIRSDVNGLFERLIAAESHELAAVEIREFFDGHSDDRTYAHSVIIGAVTMLGQHVVLYAPLDEFTGPAGMLARVQRLAFAVRGIGSAAWAAGNLPMGRA